jgi:hypothetical protein
MAERYTVEDGLNWLGVGIMRAGESDVVATVWITEDLPQEAAHSLALKMAAAEALAEALRDFLAEADAGHVSVEVDRAARAALRLSRGEGE